jgi:hypothetical protein
LHSTAEPPPSQDPPSLIIGTVPRDVYAFLDCCPRAQTMTGYSMSYHSEVVYVLPCRTWSCRPCAERKIRELACIVRDVKPNRLMTLTVNPSLYQSRKAAWQLTVKQVPILIRQLRQRFGPIEYLRVTEITKQGWPHYHLLIKSNYLPHHVVKKCWAKLTGAYIVDVRQVRKSFSAYKYLVKYLSKLHRLEWTARHVSRSKNFRSSSQWEDPNPIRPEELQFRSSHPAHVMMELYEGRKIARLSPGAYVVEPPLSWADP